MVFVYAQCLVLRCFLCFARMPCSMGWARAHGLPICFPYACLVLGMKLGACVHTGSRISHSHVGWCLLQARPAHTHSTNTAHYLVGTRCKSSVCASGPGSARYCIVCSAATTTLVGRQLASDAHPVGCTCWPRMLRVREKGKERGPRPVLPARLKHSKCSSSLGTWLQGRAAQNPRFAHRPPSHPAPAHLAAGCFSPSPLPLPHRHKRSPPASVQVARTRTWCSYAVSYKRTSQPDPCSGPVVAPWRCLVRRAEKTHLGRRSPSPSVAACPVLSCPCCLVRVVLLARAARSSSAGSRLGAAPLPAVPPTLMGR